MAPVRTLSLTALEPTTGCRTGVVSLPLPRGGPWTVQVVGCHSQAVPMGGWPRSEAAPGRPRLPRRALLYVRAEDSLHPKLHARLSPEPAADTADRKGLSAPAGWTVQVACTERRRERGDQTRFSYFKEVNELILHYGDREVGLRLGVQNRWGLHQWQFVQLEPLWSGPLCAAYVVGGHIYCGWDHHVTHEEMAYRHSHIAELPPDETITASIYFVVHNDGTVQASAHFVNGRVYHGIGRTIGMPVVLVRGLAGAASEEGKPWDGTTNIISDNGCTLDVSPAAAMVSVAHPGRLARVAADTDLLCWRAFENTRIDLRTSPAPEGGTVETVVEHSEEGLVQGAARSVGFALSFSAAPTKVVRYLAEPAWYAEHEELAPMSLMHRPGPYTEISRMGARAFEENTVLGRFTAGGIYRYLYQHGLGTYELSMDGNESRSLFRWSYWATDAASYTLALRNATFCADLAVDHARDVVHYHGDGALWNVYSLIYMRFSGLVYAWLESGDPYFLRTAKAVANNYANHHRLNWPRQGLGRDLDPLAGFGVLYDYTGEETWLDFMREVAGHAASVIQQDGTWYCGSGVGPYWGVNAAEGGPWNGGHFFHGFTEYAMRSPTLPDEWIEPARRALRKLLTELWDNEHHYHPASCGFLPRLHWYLACRLKDDQLIDLVRKLMDHLLVYKDNPTDQPMFRGGKAHHMNNYLDYLLFYEATKETLPALLAGSTDGSV